MWRHDYERLPTEGVPPWSHPSDGYRRVLNIVPKKPQLLEIKPPLLDRPGEGSYHRYYSHVGSREYDEGRSFSHDRGSGPPQRGHESGDRWSRYDHSVSHQSDYRDMRDGFRRSFYSSHYMRERSPLRRDPVFLRESPVGREDSLCNRSVSSVSSRSYSPVRSKMYSFHQSQHRSKEQQVQSLKTSRYASRSSSPAGPSSKVLDKASRLTEKELAEAVSIWAEEKIQTSEESNLSGISEFEVRPTTPSFSEQPEEPETDAADSTELFEDGQPSSHSKAIASKIKEIEQVYRQRSETFEMVVKMLIEKDPSLERPIQLALRQNLREIGNRCVEELEHFIAEYDTSRGQSGQLILPYKWYQEERGTTEVQVPLSVEDIQHCKEILGQFSEDAGIYSSPGKPSNLKVIREVVPHRTLRSWKGFLPNPNDSTNFHLGYSGSDCDGGGSLHAIRLGYNSGGGDGSGRPPLG
ncbi:periphilin-1-like [Erethizon dorsatum]